MVHNAPLHVWLKYGLAGLICYVWFHFAVFRWLHRRHQSARQTGRMPTPCENNAGATARYHFFGQSGTGKQAAEKVDCRLVLKGHGFSHAAQVLHFCHPSGALALGGSAFQTFSAASGVAPCDPGSFEARRIPEQNGPDGDQAWLGAALVYLAAQFAVSLGFTPWPYSSVQSTMLIAFILAVTITGTTQCKSQNCPSSRLR
jgi:hypothetical protein